MMKMAAANAESGDLRPEYKFDYSKACPNRFAERITDENVTVVLETQKIYEEAEDRK